MPSHRRDRWYSHAGQSQSRATAFERSSGIRRLVSLIILLVLVLVLIQQTSDTKRVEQVATAIGLLPTSSDDGSSQPIPNPIEPSEAAKASEGEGERELLSEVMMLTGRNQEVQFAFQVWASLLKRASDSTAEALSRKVFAKDELYSLDKKEIANWSDVESWFADSQILLNQWSMIESENAGASTTVELSAPLNSPLPAFIEWFKTHEEWFSKAESNETTDVSSSGIFGGLQIALDKRLINQIEDRTVFQPKDRLPFVRSWQRVDLLRETLVSGRASLSSLTKVEVPQLISDGHALRRQPIRFHGSIAKIDRNGSIDEPGFGKREYQDLWLKPSDTSNQPVRVFAPDLNIDAGLKLAENAHVVVGGFYFKRIAYASKRGGEVAPLLLAAYVGPPTTINGNSDSSVLSISNRSEIEKLHWVPPVDFMTPFAMVRNRLVPVLRGLSEPILQSGFQGADVSAVLNLILELRRLAPEVQLLTEGQSSWPIADNTELIRLSGYVTKVERFAVEQHAAITLEHPYLYRCRLETVPDENKSGQNSIVVCTTIPSAWLGSDGSPLVEIRQLCSLHGVSKKNVDQPSFVWADTIHWRRGVGSQELVASSGPLIPSLSKTDQFLLDHGWDLGWNDLIRELQIEPVKPLSQSEHEPYFTLMKMAQSSPFPSAQNPSMKDPGSRSIPDLMESLRQAKKTNVLPVLERVSMHIRVVRVSSIRVDDPIQSSILGSNHYYELDVMADIGNRSYEIKTDKGKDPVIYHKEYPVTCVAIDIPKWMKTGGGLDTVRSGHETTDSESGSRIEQVWYPRMKANASGWFYRFWSYKTQEISQSLGDNKRQIGPLVVLDSIERTVATNVTSDANSSEIASRLSAMMGVAGAIGIWWFVRKKVKSRAKPKTL